MTMRSVDTRFWHDGWAREINPLDRYLFVYLLTNDHTTWCGVYELPIDSMAFESGMDKNELKNSMLPKLSPKAIYLDGWVYIPNWLKYHVSESGNMSPQQKKGYEEAWKLVPERIRLKLKEISETGIPYVYPMGGVSASASASASAYISETDVSGSTIPLTGNENNMGWKDTRSENDDDLPSIDIDSRKEIETDKSKSERDTKELNVKIRANLKTIEPLRGIPWGTGKDMNFHVKIYRELLHSGWSHKGIISAFMEVVDTPHWKERTILGEYPGINTVQFHLRNKKPL